MTVLDANGYVQKFDTNGKFLGKWGAGVGTGDGQFQAPWCMAADQQDHIYIADQGNDFNKKDVANRIQIFDADGQFLAKWDHSNNSSLSDVACVTADQQDNIYVASYNENQIQKFDSQGKLLTAWGSAGSGDGQYCH